MSLNTDMLRCGLATLALLGSTLAMAQSNSIDGHAGHSQSGTGDSTHADNHGRAQHSDHQPTEHGAAGSGHCAGHACRGAEHRHHEMMADQHTAGHDSVTSAAVPAAAPAPQQETQHAQDTHQNHQMMQQEAMSSMDMSMDMAMPGPQTLRDPHDHSNGYERDSGPYLLPPGSRISLADETLFTGLWVDRFEYVESHDTDATEFEGHVWIGDSYNRYLLRTEVDIVNDSLEVAEVDLMHSRAITPFWDLRFGVRREFGDEDGRNWASVGLSGLAPYWFEIDASLFIGENGNTLLDIEAEYDLLLTQRLVMQPRIDVHSYGKTDRDMGVGSGLSALKTGFRLRYEFDRQFAPYLGVERVIKYGETADLLPADQDREDTHWIVGFKFWF